MYDYDTIPGGSMQRNLDDMIFNLVVNHGGTSTFNLGTASPNAAANYFKSTDPSLYTHGVDGFLVST